MSASRFDAEFYRRFYLDRRTRVTTQGETERRGRALAALMDHLEIPVRTILDAGCGLGWIRAPLLEAFPGARYVGLEVSEELCRSKGWVQASLADFNTRQRFDLIVCHDVMQYLSDREAARALANLGRLCRGALYFYAPTCGDWAQHADVNGSDADVQLREAVWYRRRLARNFRYLGFGLHVRRGVNVHQWELEAPHC